MFSALIIDAYPIFRAAVKTVLEKNGFTVIAEASNGIQGLEIMQAHRPHLIVLDIDLLGMSGLEVIKKIHEFDGDIRTLVLTSSHTVHFYNRCKIALASGLLSKACSVEEFEQVLNGIMKASACGKGGFSFWPNEFKVNGNEALLISSLSDRELTTFQLLARGMGNKEIANYLQLSSKTISTYKVRLLKKLNVFSVQHLAEMAELNKLP